MPFCKDQLNSRHRNGARISTDCFSSLLPFGKVWFGWISFAVCNAWQRSRTHSLRRVGENSGPILSRLWTKVHEIFRQRRRSLLLTNVLARLSVSRFIQEIFAIKSRSIQKRTNAKAFLAPKFFGEMIPTFLQQIVREIYCPLLGKVWLSSVCWSTSAKPGNELEYRIYVGWVKCQSNFKSFVDQSLCRLKTI